MTTQTLIPEAEPTIVMSRSYAAPRQLVWECMTEPRHVQQWWGGPGFSSPVCDMDVRPGGEWRHVLRFPDGKELSLHFVFLEVLAPERLVWQHADHGSRTQGPPTSVTTVTLEARGAQTHWTMSARFNSMAERQAALEIGFTRPIAASSDRLVEYLRGLKP